jgi:hypothetical protein
MHDNPPKSPPAESLDADVSHEAWQAEGARREATILPTDVEFGPCKLPTPHTKPPDKRAVAPRLGVSTNPATIDARRVIKMGQRSAGGTDLDATVLLLRAAADPASTLRIECVDRMVLESAKLLPDLAKGAFIGERGAEYQFEDTRISFEAWAKWLAANGYVGFRPGTAAWREPVKAEPAAAVARPQRRKIARVDYENADMVLVREMKQLIDEGKASGATHAARAIIPKAAGRGNESNKVKRLTRRFTATYRDSCPHVDTNGQN